MNNHMMAAVLYGKEHLQVEPVAVPTIEGGVHISSIEFRTGVLSPLGEISAENVTRFVNPPEIVTNPTYEKAAGKPDSPFAETHRRNASCCRTKRPSSDCSSGNCGCV